MNSEDEQLLRARALRADILAAPSIWLPRRDVVLDWLNALLQRAAAPTYQFTATEMADLAALEQFLRTQNIPVAVPS